MTDVIISPSSQTANQYAGGGTGVADSEHRHMRDIAPMLDDLLQRNGVDSKILWDTDLATRIRQSNANPPLLHFALHSNAGGTAYGASCWVYRKGTKSEVMAREIHSTLMALTPWPDLGVIAYNHYETRETLAYAVIAEVAFHDKTEPAEWIRTHKRDIAVALARGIINALAKAYGGKFVDIAARPLLLDGGGGMGPVVVEPAPAPAPTPAPAPVKNSRAHRTYATGEVERIQRILSDLGYYKGALDDDYGNWTHDAVEAYQRAQRFGSLVPDGDWGPATEAHYQWTRTLQETMNRWKGDDIRVDGDYRRATDARVWDLMRRNERGAYLTAARALGFSSALVDGVPGRVFCHMLSIPTHPNL